MIAGSSVAQKSNSGKIVIFFKCQFQMNQLLNFNRTRVPALALILTVTLMPDSVDPEHLIWNALTREFD
jgi:hypothetical protein